LVILARTAAAKQVNGVRVTYYCLLNWLQKTLLFAVVSAPEEVNCSQIFNFAFLLLQVIQQQPTMSLQDKSYLGQKKNKNVLTVA
jgi:hypothetical protein